MGLRQSKMSQIYISLNEQPVRSSVSRLSRQQNYSMIVPTLDRQGVDTVFTDDRLSIFATSLELLLFLGVGETATRYGVRWSAPNQIFTDFLPSYFSSRAVRTSCWTKPSSSKEELSSRKTLMQLKTELAMVVFQMILIWDIRVSMVEMLLLILVYSRCKRESPSLQIYKGPSQYMTALSYIRRMPQAFSNNSLHFTSHSLYLFWESFSSLISVLIFPQIVLKFLTTSSQAFFSASFTFSAMMANFLLISETSLSFSLPIFFTIFSLNSSLLIFESRATFFALYVWNCLCLLSITWETSLMVLNLWSLWLPNSAQCAHSFTRSFRQMISSFFLCSQQKSDYGVLTGVIGDGDRLLVERVSLEDSCLVLLVLSRLLFSLSNLARVLFLGKYSISTSSILSSWPQCKHRMVAILSLVSACLRQGEQALCSQQGIMRGWLPSRKEPLQRQQESQGEFICQRFEFQLQCRDQKWWGLWDERREGFCLGGWKIGWGLRETAKDGSLFIFLTMERTSHTYTPLKTFFPLPSPISTLTPNCISALAQIDNHLISSNNWSMQAEPLPPAHRFRINQLVHGSNATLAKTQILIVGVGGIGCEILKVLCKSPIGKVHILDMDTIELSNLNRQFLFKQQHKGMSKALVAKQSVLKLNPTLNIEAHHMNIKDLPIAFFRQFDILVLALDNIEARNYVNKIGVRLGIPIVDAGTLAYKGNATTILSQVSRCYSCEPKVSNQKVFPVCTIRMRPEKPIHCIVWAKMLFQALFSGDNQDNDLKDLSELAALNDQLAMLRKIYQVDIENIRNAKSDTDNKLSQIFAKNIKSVSDELLVENVSKKVLGGYRLHDKVQPLETSISAFVESFQRLSVVKREQGALVFEKDDDDIIHFITSAANLRMFCFTIPQQSFNEVKNMAGNIVPAIASTNSIVSGIEIIEMLKYLRGQQAKMKSYFIQNQVNKVMALKLEKPLPTCAVCSPSAIPVTFQCNFNKFTLRELVEYIQENSPSLQEFSINQGSKEIYNTDDPKQALLCKTLLQICESYQIDLILTNEETSKNVCTIWMIHSEQQESISVSGKEKLIPQQQPQPIEEEKKNGVQHDDDSDVVVFGDQEDSPQLQIIEVKKRPGDQNDPEASPDRTRKRQKLE